MYIRFSWSVGVAGGRKEVSTHTDTMVQFPFASPQDAARIYTRATHTHTQTQKLTPNRKSTRDAFIDFTAVDFSYEKKPQNSLYIRITCWISAAICGTCNCQKTGKDMGNKWWNLVFFFFFLQRLHTLSCLAYALICDNFYSPWLYLLKHFHLW